MREPARDDELETSLLKAPREAEENGQYLRLSNPDILKVSAS
jgi:hypothetical protein